MKEINRTFKRADTRSILALVSVIGIQVQVILLFFKPIPQNNVSLLNTLIPMLLTGTIGACFGFYFGSSKGDTDKLKKETEVETTTPSDTNPPKI